MQSTFTPSRSATSSRSSGSKRASCRSAVAPISHGAMKTLRADFDQPDGGGAPGEVALARTEPVLGLHALARQVALAVADRLRLAGRAGREGDQGRVVGRKVRGGRRRPSYSDSSGIVRSGPSKPASRTASASRSSATHGARLCEVHPRAQVLRAQLLGARAARRRRCGSRRPSPRPTRAGCRSRSSRRPRGDAALQQRSRKRVPRARTARRR